MGKRGPHKGALPNREHAVISEAKIRYALRNFNKRRAFEALGYREEDWRELHTMIIENLSFYPASISHEDQWGLTCNVDMLITGPENKTAPVRTKWIFRSQEDEDFPRLVTLYVKTMEWRRREREKRL